jgi:hypothetical protein
MEMKGVYCAVRTVFICFVWISEQTAIISDHTFYTNFVYEIVVKSDISLLHSAFVFIIVLLLCV